MGINNYNTKNEGDVVLADDPNQYKTGLTGDIVPRNASGVPANAAGSVGTDSYKWKNGKFDGTVESNAFKQTANLPAQKSIVTMDTSGNLAGDAQFGSAFTESGGTIALANNSVGYPQLATSARVYSFSNSLGSNSVSSSTYSFLVSLNGASRGVTEFRYFMVFYKANNDAGGLRYTNNISSTNDRLTIRVRRTNPPATEIFFNYSASELGPLTRSSGFYIGIMPIGFDLATIDVYWKVTGNGGGTFYTENASLEFVGLV